MDIHEPLQIRGETRYPGGVSISCLANRTRHECPRHNKSVYKVYYVDTCVWYKWFLVSRGGGGDNVPVNHIVFSWLYSKKKTMVILTPKSQRLSNSQKYFCQILMVHYEEIKNTKTFCINQEVTLGQIWRHISYLNVKAHLSVVSLFQVLDHCSDIKEYSPIGLFAANQFFTSAGVFRGCINHGAGVQVNSLLWDLVQYPA